MSGIYARRHFQRPPRRACGPAAVDCGSLLPLLPKQPCCKAGAAGRGAELWGDVHADAPPRRSRLRPPQRQQAAAVHGDGCATASSRLP